MYVDDAVIIINLLREDAEAIKVILEAFVTHIILQKKNPYIRLDVKMWTSTSCSPLLQAPEAPSLANT
jgi:hypothetical protein